VEGQNLFLGASRDIWVSDLRDRQAGHDGEGGGEGGREGGRKGGRERGEGGREEMTYFSVFSNSTT